ncbi:MAG: hypothetical protein ACRD0P_16375, partial [Stackebrandtia sp.]
VIGIAAFLPGGQTAMYLTGGLICLLAVITAWWSADESPIVTHLALFGGALWSWKIGYLVAGELVSHGPATLMLRHLLGATAALVITGLCLVGASLALNYVALLGGVTLLGALGAGALSAGMTDIRAACLLAMGCLFALATLPRLFLAGSGLFGLDRRVEAGAVAESAELRRRMSSADTMLFGGLAALSVTAGGAALLLVSRGSLWDALLGTGIAIALLTRSRIVDQIRHVAPLRIVGSLIACAAAWVWVGEYPQLGPWVPAVAVLAALVYVGVATIERSTVAAARTRRIVGVAEILLVAGLLVLSGQVMGLYELIADTSGPA